MYLLEMAMCGFRLFMLCGTRYHTDLQQMSRTKRQTIRQNGHFILETSCKVGVQPEGAHYDHSETVIT